MFVNTWYYIYAICTLQIVTPWNSFQMSFQGLLYVLFSNKRHLCSLQEHVPSSQFFLLTSLFVAFCAA